jgi:uncharacterized protein YjiS (DUF1127 family)
MRAHMQIPSERLARGPAPDQWARIDPIVYLTAARRLQARATSEAIGAGWRWVRRRVTGLASLLQDRLLEPIARRSQRQRALAELATMDDRLLADIGLQRSDIALAVDGRLADPRMARRASAADLGDRLLQGERCPTPTATANSNRPVAPAAPGQAPELAA